MNPLRHDAAQLRAFNRFHTGRIGVLQERMLDSRLSLAQVRVLYELSLRNGVLASQLARELGLDPGYLSRLLAGFRRKRWITMAPASADKRRRPIVLTKGGRAAFEPLDRRSQTGAESMLAPLDSARRQRLVDALRTVRELLGDRSLVPGPIVLRSHRPGDIGLVAQRHGQL